MDTQLTFSTENQNADSETNFANAREFRSSWVMAYILKFANDNGHPLNKTLAQGVLYCCYGVILAAFNERLTDEHPKAWPYGPVFPRTINDINKKRLTEGMVKTLLEKCPPWWLNWVNKTISTFWSYTATEMSNWMRLKDGPWNKADPLASIDDREIALWFRDYLQIVEERGTKALETPKTA